MSSSVQGIRFGFDVQYRQCTSTPYVGSGTGLVSGEQLRTVARLD